MRGTLLQGDIEVASSKSLRLNESIAGELGPMTRPFKEYKGLERENRSLKDKNKGLKGLRKRICVKR